MVVEPWEASVSQLVTPARELAAVFEEAGDKSVWLEPVYALALVTERIPQGDDYEEQQAIMPVCEYGSGEMFLGPASAGYLGVLHVPPSMPLPGRCGPRNRAIWARVQRLIRRHRASAAEDDGEGEVVDLVKRMLVRPGTPRPPALQTEMTESRAASLFLAAGQVLARSRPSLGVDRAVERVRSEFDLPGKEPT
jgi:hypothetical protein